MNVTNIMNVESEYYFPHCTVYMRLLTEQGRLYRVDLGSNEVYKEIS